MAKIDCIVGSSIIIYIATVITEIVSSVPVGLTQADFGDNCILSAKVKYNSANFTMIITSFGSPGACGFCTYLTIITVLYALAYGSYSAYALYKSTDNAQQMWVLPAIMACLLLFILKFISSCILSIGFSQFCKSVSSSDDIESCQQAQVKAPFWYYNQNPVTGSNYYAYMTTAQLDYDLTNARNILTNSWNKIMKFTLLLSTYSSTLVILITYMSEGVRQRGGMSASWFCVFEWFLLTALGVLHYRRNMALRSFGGFDTGFGSSDTQGIVTDDVLPGT